ncbi:MAG: hypothetical protein AAB308_08565 [Nitrospirota bacterium]|jgi:hypothetical protein
MKKAASPVWGAAHPRGEECGAEEGTQCTTEQDPVPMVPDETTAFRAAPEVLANQNEHPPVGDLGTEEVEQPMMVDRGVG